MNASKVRPSLRAFFAFLKDKRPEKLVYFCDV